jgi:transposase
MSSASQNFGLATVEFCSAIRTFRAFRLHRIQKRACTGASSPSLTLLIRSLARIDSPYYTATHGHGKSRKRAIVVVGRDLGLAEIAEPSFLRAVERTARVRQLRPVRREDLSAVLRAGHGTAEPGAGRYFRLLLLGYFEGIDSERGIAWRAMDSLAVRSFLRLGVDEAAPDHTAISRTRRLIDLETHRDVFTWVQQRLVEAGLLKGQTLAIDATTLEANAAMRSIVRRDTGELYQAFLTRLAQASGIETPTRDDLARLDRKRKKKTSNKDWTNPYDPDAKVTKMKDGRTHLAHKAEHAVDLETGAIVAVTLQGADKGDTATIVETAVAAAEQVEDAQARPPGPATARRDHRG